MFLFLRSAPKDSSILEVSSLSTPRKLTETSQFSTPGASSSKKITITTKTQQQRKEKKPCRALAAVITNSSLHTLQGLKALRLMGLSQLDYYYYFLVL